MGETDKHNLEAELNQSGWQLSWRECENWWEHECWELASTCRPVGAKAFMTFLIDPQNRSQHVSSVWAVIITRERPSDRMGNNQITIPVRPRWPERIKKIAAATNQLRPHA